MSGYLTSESNQDTGFFNPFKKTKCSISTNSFYWFAFEKNV